MPATPVARAQIVPSIVPNQNPLLPPTIGDITVTAQNPAGPRVLSDLSEVLPDDTSIVVDVVVNGGVPAWIFLQNRKTSRGSGVTTWNTVNPVNVSLPSTGTYDLTFTITGDSLNSTISNFVAVKRP